MATRAIFSSSSGTLLTMAGAAIGLGNVWRFPYMMESYGGSAFLFVFLMFMFLFAVPAIAGEWALGREARSGAVGSFAKAVGPFWGRIIGYLLIFGVLVANSYYLIIIANVVFSSFYSVFFGFSDEAIPQYTELLSDGVTQYSIAACLLLFACFVVHRGLNDGIEKISKIFVPLFFTVMLILIGAVFSIDGATQHALEFLKPDFNSLTLKSIFAAMGQAFFSVGLGGTYILIYGSYMRRDASLVRGAIFTGVSDTSAALLAALFVIPTILVFGLDVASGPQLIFVTLPHLFNQMPYGNIVGSVFLLAFSLVAYLSAIGAIEVIVGGVSDDYDKHKLTRNRVIMLFVCIELVLMLPSAFMPNIIATLDLFFGSGLQVLGSCMALLAVTWGLGRKKTLMQIFGRDDGWTPRLFFFWLQWVIPVALVSVLLGYVYDIVSSI
jgi:NSS family neurotransmitter:Na+ symporter